MDSDGDGITDEEENSLHTNPGSPDTDDDGLLDGWEAHGYWRAGSLEPLPAYGADPREKDVFVELDWMADENLSPLPNAIIAYQAAVDVTRVFRRSGTRIVIHFDLGPRIASILPAELIEPDVDFSAFDSEPDEEKVIPYQDRFHSRPDPGARTGSSTISLYETYFGGKYFRPSRRNLFYYVVFAEQSQPPEDDIAEEGSRNHPYADSFSDDLARRDGLVNAGIRVGVIFRKPMAALSPELLRYQYSVALLHELGHAFGFGHGGASTGFKWDNTNWKPNYPSIMNYRFHGCGVDILGGIPVMDFSHGLLKVPLNEGSLFEIVGMGTIPNSHILDCADVRQPVDGAGFPASLDWNKDQRLNIDPIHLDLNGDSRLEVLTDHDDWGKLVFEGFDGIGRNAFRGCGLVCGHGDDVIAVSCDQNKDGRTDLFLARGGRTAWAFSTGTGGLEIAPQLDPGAAAGGTWPFEPGDAYLAGDFLGAGHDMLFSHRGREAAIIDRDERAPRLAWYADSIISDGAPDAGGGWKLGPSDRFIKARLTSSSSQDIIVTNGREMAILSGTGTDSPVLLTSWMSGLALTQWTRGEASTIRKGRSFPDGSESVFIVSTTSLIEIVGPATKPRIARIDNDGVVPPAPQLQKGWELSSEDEFVAADLDGDGVEELTVKGTQRMGVVRWDGDGFPWLEWIARGSLDGRWPMSRDASTERLYCGHFVEGGGKELLLSNGQSWVTLTWRENTRSLKIHAINNGNLIDDPLRQVLRRGQALIPGRFLPGAEDSLLMQDDSSLLLARCSANGFRLAAIASSPLGSWILQPDDILEPANLDSDPELEILVRNGDRFGVIDFSPEPSTPFIANLDVEKLQFESIPRFRRGDANGDGGVDISDVVLLLGYLFLGFDSPHCMDATDMDDSGFINVGDPIFLLSYLFNKGKDVPPPGPFSPGIDPTADSLQCDE